MSNAVPPRGLLTDHLIDWLEAQLAPGALVGDAIAPDGGGWTVQGEPNVGEFVPYVVVKTGPANPAEREGMNRRHSSWLMSYGLAVTGGLRNQCDYLADITRALVVGLPESAGAWLEGWAVQEAYFAALGSIQRNDATSPPSMTLDDVVVLRVERSRS